MADTEPSSPPPQLGTMIPSQPSVLEECGHFIPDHGDLRVLLRHQKQKGFLTTNGKARLYFEKEREIRENK